MQLGCFKYPGSFARTSRTKLGQQQEVGDCLGLYSHIMGGGLLKIFGNFVIDLKKGLYYNADTTPWANGPNHVCISRWGANIEGP